MAEELESASHLVLAQYQGLKFQELCELRARLKPLQCRFRVVKNSMLNHALKQARIPERGEGLFRGPLALMVSREGDILSSAKVLSQFCKDYPLLKVQAAYYQDRWLSTQDFKTLALLPVREVLLAQVLRVIAGPIYNLLYVLQAPIQNVAGTLQAVLNQRQSSE